MTIQYLLGNTILHKASTALTLSLTPITNSNQKEKIELICMRNRIFEQLQKRNSPVLNDRVKTIQNFFNELGGDNEKEISPLSSFSLIQKAIESAIANSIIASLKPASQCSQSELKEKQTQEDLKNQILERAKEKASPLVRARIESLLGLLDPLTIELLQSDDSVL